MGLSEIAKLPKRASICLSFGAFLHQVSDMRQTAMAPKQLTIESLELRSLLAVTVSLAETTGVLSIGGTDGADQINVSQSGDTLVLTITGGAKQTFKVKQISSLRFDGRDGDDQFVNKSQLSLLAYGNAGNDLLIGGSSNDEIHGGPGNDRIAGNEGNDSLHGDYGDDAMSGGVGNDELFGWYGNDTLYGDVGDDYLSGYEGDDLLYGGDGNDDLRGHIGNDRLFGEKGNDLLYGWLGNDLLFGGPNDDYLSGWSGNDLLVGGDGNDQLLGHEDRDVLIGGKGCDGLDGGLGENLIIGGWTQYDDNLASLERLMAVWTSNDSYKNRVSLLSNSRNKDLKLDQSTVKTDGQSDTFVKPQANVDWVFSQKKDKWS